MSSPLLIKSRGFQPGYVEIASPKESMLRWITVGRLGLLANTPYESATGEQELVINLLSGTVTLESDSLPPTQVGGRQDPFRGGPSLICIPPSTTYRIVATTPTADAVLFSAPAPTGKALQIVRPEDAPMTKIGAGNWTRSLWPGTGNVVSTQRLLIGETINSPGCWSSFPPHKHDTDDPPREAVYEEVYFFTVKPAGGFAIQRVYERRQAPDALDETITVEDGDTVIIPRGYHPVVAAPGYQVAYIWALCGNGRAYGAWSDDPEYAWLRAVEPILTTRD
jgi:5-deoxy-glucuronate isomerase